MPSWLIFMLGLITGPVLLFLAWYAYTWINPYLGR